MLVDAFFARVSPYVVSRLMTSATTARVKSCSGALVVGIGVRRVLLQAGGRGGESSSRRPPTLINQCMGQALRTPFR